MPALMEPPPYSPIEPVTETLHGVSVTDPYRWLEDQESPRTREWLAAQTRYARAYLDSISGRELIRDRIRQLLDVETYDSLQKVDGRYFFRRRLRGQEQPCICLRDGSDSPDQVLIDPAHRGTGPHTAVRPLRVSPDGRLLLYEIKQGGERTGAFELLDIQKREILPDVLARGYLRGFAFAPDSQAFYYIHEALGAARPDYRAAYRHVLGTSFTQDEEVFFAGEGEKLRLCLIPGKKQMGFLVIRFLENPLTDFYLWPVGNSSSPKPIIRNAEYQFAPLLLMDGRILALTDLGSPNLRIVEVHGGEGMRPEFIDLVPSTDLPIQDWAVSGGRIFVSYVRQFQTEVDIFDCSGLRQGQLPMDKRTTVRLVGGSEDTDELFLEQESFLKPIQVWSYSVKNGETRLWWEPKLPFDQREFSCAQVWFTAKDGISIPMFLVGHRDVLESGSRPVIMTSYGAHGVSMTPQFSVFVAFLMERGCLFALPNIRGGSEFGCEWHRAAQRRHRQVAFDDFLAAAEWLIQTGRTEPGKLAIFGGSNSGLLVGAAMTQRPDLFRAVVCIVPMLDMLRYHLFDNAHVWKEELGTADDSADFEALLAYSPYQRVHDGTAYPATMMISGDSDQNCNPLHARKMTARLQAANVSEQPILLDYSQFRGHSPVLPLKDRIEALTDRMAFLCEQLQLSRSE